MSLSLIHIFHIKKGDIIDVGYIAGCLLGGMNKYQIADYRNFATLTTILQLRNDKARGKIIDVYKRQVIP